MAATTWRVRVRDPRAFTPGSFRTIRVGRRGVQLVVGRLRGRRTMTVQALRFPKGRFTTRAMVRDWLRRNGLAGLAHRTVD